MSSFATRAAFTTPASQPVLRFLGSPERLLVAGGRSPVVEAAFHPTYSAYRLPVRRVAYRDCRLAPLALI